MPQLRPEPPSLESAVVFATARRELGEADRAVLLSASARGVDWTAVVRGALAHGTGTLLCHHLLTLPSDKLPAAMHAAAEAVVAGRRAANAAVVEQLFGLLDALETAGIEAVPFKGPALAAEAFGDIALREFRDLDLLIDEAAIDAAMTVLRHLGYRSQAEGLSPQQMAAYYRYNGQDILFRDGSLPVEPHWAFAPSTFSVHFRAADVMRRAQPAPLAGRMLRLPTPEDAVIIAAVHGAKERWHRLLWVADMAGLIQRHPAIDWDVALRRATSAGVRRMMLLGLALADDLLGAPLPDELRRVVAADTGVTALRSELRMAVQGAAAPSHSIFRLSRFGWRVRERWADRLRYVVATTTTARLHHYRMFELAGPLAVAYPGVKLAHDYVAAPLWSALKALGLVRRE
ncbi:nucleotidyltransferase domain-containing protein [Neoroseomonas lacus]|uniref:Nucleotidyltransferase family protein n=1 Tax=Neoroseomonas lacus TaxID=287609 RepID=A0A917K845_9PROT|nr:nucleotidyltransferase family protein [Neoroseomonas lacus]GGJ03444.1 hypothetical protein GCM10011320_08060 [Neoroseomonas lacus]